MKGAWSLFCKETLCVALRGRVGCLCALVLALKTSLLEAILFKCVRRIPRGGRTIACLGKMGQEEQQQGWSSVISNVWCRGNHGASQGRVAMGTDQMEEAGGTVNLPSLSPFPQEDTCLGPCEELAERGPWKPGPGRRQVARCGRGLEILQGTVTCD